MTNDDKLIAAARKEVLAAFQDAALDAGALRALVEGLRAKAEMLQAYHEDETCEPVEAERLRWSGAYFNRQKFFAERNFSIERLLHLIEVRDHLRTQGVRGFAAVQPAASHKADMSSPPRNPAAANDASTYQPSENLRKFVEGGDLRTIRAALRFELNNNRLSRAHLLAALDWARARVEGVCVPYEEKEFANAIDADRSHWTADYFDTQTVYLKTNFSAERYAHLVDVRIDLRERGVAGFVPTDNAAGQVHEGGKPAGSGTRERTAAGGPAQTPRAPRAGVPPESGRSTPSLFKLAMLVGGALAAALILLTLVK
ncbi:hypothetical protein [Burkholderia gladioli]|uniref:Uncharacterized protein n=1 Tax=Burkholderia gladioli (strain BSR3) TaxID=999541 RepID=F2LB54_BURGS|nr:hypothetical protein [Burkholderia gladioli]AEA60123.1 hypothetical protein bgla_1g14530 [Burkholderia gladioli BSR3]